MYFRVERAPALRQKSSVGRLAKLVGDDARQDWVLDQLAILRTRRPI